MKHKQRKTVNERRRKKIHLSSMWRMTLESERKQCCWGLSRGVAATCEAGERDMLEHRAGCLFGHGELPSSRGGFSLR